MNLSSDPLIMWLHKERGHQYYEASSIKPEVSWCNLEPGVINNSFHVMVWWQVNFWMSVAKDSVILKT